MRFSWVLLLFSSTLLAQPPGGGLAPLMPPPQPPENPVTTAKVSLGKVLFWDEQLSSTGTTACGTCHRPADGGSDLRSRSADPLHPGADAQFGNGDDVQGSPGVPLHFDDGSLAWSTIFGLDVQVTGRKSPPAIDAAYTDTLFWDGRAEETLRDPLTGEIVIPDGAALENQVLGPPVSDAEMGHIDRNWDEVAARIASSKPLALSPSLPAALAHWIDRRDYPQLFAEVFGDEAVTPVRIAMAIASYERVLYSDQTPLDGTFANTENLTQQEQRGRNLFIQNDCVACHRGATLSDGNFHYIGVRPQNEDLGRFEVTGNNPDRGRFKTPGLRNVALRGPYMHNGRFQTLDEVVDFYNRGGDFNAPNKDNRIRPLGLNQQERNALVAFMTRPLTDPRVTDERAPFDRPVLYSESARVPTVGGGGSLNVHANEPPLAGSNQMTVAVSGGPVAAEAVLVIDDADPGMGSIPTSAALARIETDLQGTGNSAGYASVPVILPENSAGRQYFGRWYVDAPGGLLVSPLFSFTAFSSSEQTWCLGDLDSDGSADIRDLIGIVNELGATCPVPCRGDLDASARVDEDDLERLASVWQTCNHP